MPENGKIIKLAMEIGLIFGAPAIIAGVVGRHWSKNHLVLLLGASFVLSWVIFLVRYFKIINPPDKGDKGGLK